MQLIESFVELNILHVHIGKLGLSEVILSKGSLSNPYKLYDYLGDLHTMSIFSLL